MSHKFTDADDIKFINNPIDWPRWPFLPVKRMDKNHFPEHGIIHVNDRTLVKKVGLYHLPSNKEEFDALADWKYDSVEALVKDGWTID